MIDKVMIDGQQVELTKDMFEMALQILEIMKLYLDQV